MCLYSCISYPAHKAHPFLCSVTLPYITCLAIPSFSTLSDSMIFGKIVLNIKCVHWVSLQILSEIFLILRRTESDIIIKVHRCSSKVPVVLFVFQASWIYAFRIRKKFWWMSDSSSSTSFTRRCLPESAEQVDSTEFPVHAEQTHNNCI